MKHLMKKTLLPASCLASCLGVFSADAGPQECATELTVTDAETFIASAQEFLSLRQKDSLLDLVAPASSDGLSDPESWVTLALCPFGTPAFLDSHPAALTTDKSLFSLSTNDWNARANSLFHVFLTNEEPAYLSDLLDNLRQMEEEVAKSPYSDSLGPDSRQRLQATSDRLAYFQGVADENRAAVPPASVAKIFSGQTASAR